MYKPLSKITKKKEKRHIARTKAEGGDIILILYTLKDNRTIV